MGDAFGRMSVVAQVGDDRETRVSSPGETAAAAAFTPASEKYQVLGEIGAGGMGEVVLVHDRDLRRDVAMKVIRREASGEPAMKRKFVAEAQATSQLEHPGIPPVYDIGVGADGKVWFTMKVVRGRTLTEVLRELFLGRKETRKEYTLHKLMTVLERIAETVHFAHEKGVVHRDLKPDNVMLGEYGEVHVMDWGIARVGATTEDETAAGVSTLETDEAVRTMLGTVKGTVPYMSPEQARGLPLDRRTDVYALGAMLYEMLTLQPAFDVGGMAGLRKVQEGDYPPVETRNPRRPVPEALATLQRRAMAKDPAERPQTAHDLAVELRSFLDGRAEKERKHREAETLAAQGRDAMARYVAARDSIDGLEREAERIGAQFKSWQSLEEKAPLLDAQDAVAAARKAQSFAFAETTKLLEGALLAEPDNPTARTLLADLWRGRLEDAERRRDATETDFALTMLRRYDDGGLAAYISGEGSLTLTSDPPGAKVALIEYQDRRGVLVPGPERDLGTTPFAPVPLPMGSYLCILRLPGFPDVRYPVDITRNRHWTGRVKMRTREEIGEGFVYVPGGPFAYGEGKDTRTIELPDFAIAEKPVTFGDWAEFLAAMEAERGSDEASRFKCDIPSVGPCMERGEDGRWRPNSKFFANEAVAKRHGADYSVRLPASGVSWHDATAYCAWRTTTTGKEWRLPTEEEREKAARGVDGRVCPWGDRKDASLAKCVDSREERSHPEPVGCFPTATSVYGMIDASGGIWDWTDSWFDSRAALRVIRGGGWNDAIGFLRCANRGRTDPGLRYPDTGFRPARSLAP